MQEQIENNKLLHPLVSIITVNYGQSEATIEFLESLKKITYQNTEIFVVDNASPNSNDIDLVKELFPKIILLKTGKNLGFAGGNNVAVRQAKGKYILFINNDTEVEPNFLEPMVELLENDPTIGIVSPKIYYFHTPNTFQFAGFTPINPITIRNFAIGIGEEDKGQYDIICETGSVFGAAMLVPRKVIEEIGMMTEVFFLYYEEHDWAERIKKAGYKIYFDGRSIVHHKESISTVKDSSFQIYYLNRGRILYARRNTKGFKKILSMLFLYLVSMPKLMIQYCLKGRFDLARSILRACNWNIIHHNKTLFASPKF